jgi:uncharacterized membrane protein YbhN (UPF0104 family)
MAATARSHTHRPSWKKLALLALAVVAVYGIVPQLGGLKSAWPIVRQARPGWVLLTIGVFALTYLAAAALYGVLAMRRLHYGRTLLVQVAGMFANRLLPAGVGAIGINYLYLRRERHTQVEAGAVVAANNTLGFLGHVSLLIVLIVTSGSALAGQLRWSLPRPNAWWLAVGIIIVLVLLAALVLLRRQAHNALKHIGQVLLVYQRRPGRLLAAYLLSMLLTLLYAGTLYAAMRALGLGQLSLLEVFIGFSIGVIGATVTPTPGGLGGAEAGLAAGLLLYGRLSAAEVLAAVLLYRLVTYWLALVAGGVAFVAVERRRLP